MAYSTVETDTTTRVNQTLGEFFERSIEEAGRVSPAYAQLWQSIYTLIRSGGKRFRPQMTLLAYEAFGGKDSESILPIAAAQELLHQSLLVHDDIIDRDYIRYGTSNVAGQYQKFYEPFVDDTHERTHYANSAAILGGDLLLAGAHQLIAESTLSSEDKVKVQALLTRSIFEVAGGELLDTESSFVPYNEGDAMKIIRYKTTGYSFIGPLLTGATLAGASRDDMATLEKYAISTGAGFQLADDILGMFGVEDVLGKSTSGDIREGKRNYIAEQAIRALSSEQRIIFDRIYGNVHASSEEIAQIRELFIAVGAKDKTETAIAAHVNDAREALALLPLNDEHREKFDQLIIKVTNRSF